MNAQEYRQWRKSLTEQELRIANVAARYHADVTADMLDQAFVGMKQLQENHNYLESRVLSLSQQLSDLKRRVAALEQFFNANDSPIPEG